MSYKEEIRGSGRFVGRYSAFDLRDEIAYDYTITLESFYDDGRGGDRWSWEVNRPGNLRISGGYGDDGEIAYPTREAALESAIRTCWPDNEDKRDMMIKHLMGI